MKDKRQTRQLANAQRNRTLLNVSTQTDNIRGFVVGIGDEWLLIHEVDTEWMRMSGYVALRRSEIEKIQQKDVFVSAMLALNQERPTPQPDVLLNDLPDMLSSANAVFPLVTLELEQKHPDCCYIGCVIRLGKKMVTLQEINPKAQWKYTRRWRLSDITQVGFGGPYAAALWRIGGTDLPETAWPGGEQK